MTAALAREAEKVRTATQRRNALIVQARNNGATFRDIAEQTGLSHTAIRKIVERSAGGTT